MKPYIVTLCKDVDYNQFWQEIENTSTGLEFVPDRAVPVHYDQPYLNRNCIYELTVDEAEHLRKDPRVQGVDDLNEPEAQLNVVQTGNNFNKLTAPGEFFNINPYDLIPTSNKSANWGLVRCNSPINNYGSGSTISSHYNYTLDGTGVDIIIIDSGVEAEHPEFSDANGQSRIQKINWFDYAPDLTPPNGFNPDYFYVDVNGHGTSVMSIAAGKVNGWAKNANLYSIKNSDLVGVVDSQNGISLKSGNVASVILGFHANKAADPITGQRSPTIVNLSITYARSGPTDALSNTTANITYRGETAIRSASADFGKSVADTEIFKEFYGLPSASDAASTLVSGYREYGIGTTRTPMIYESLNGYLDQLIEAGIHVVLSAGNDYQKIDVPGGPDYNNYVTHNGIKYYYNRKQSPYSPGAIVVGATDEKTHNDSLDQKAIFSNYGPGVDVYAPGVGIVAATSSINTYSKKHVSTVPYSGNNRYKQGATAGTSASAPAVVGVAALFLQLNPNLTPAQLKQMIIKHAKPAMYTGGNVNNYGDWFNFRSVNSPTTPLVLYNPFNAHEQEISTGGIQISRTQK